ncbi:MAG: hypothetical protein IPJ30_14110 [Acidobacteria bacterium]|nr:hypothetical protein [Acidobacteriota bacterium]
MTELDYGMAAGIALSRGSRGTETELRVRAGLSRSEGKRASALAEGENTTSIHGLSMFSRYPMRNAHAVDLPNGQDVGQGETARLSARSSPTSSILWAHFVR